MQIKSRGSYYMSNSQDTETSTSSTMIISRVAERRNMSMGVKITPTIDMMIEAAVKELDIQNSKIEAELKKD